MLEPDGWLSARQNVLVAFDEHEDVVGHAAFHVEPSFEEERHHGVEARLDDVDVQPERSRGVLRIVDLEICRRISGIGQHGDKLETRDQFTQELATAELPVAAPLVIGGQTLFRYREFRFAAFPWMRGRAPELDAPEAERAHA